MRLTIPTLAGDLRLAGFVALALAGLAGCPKEADLPPVSVESFTASHTEVTSGETVIFRWKAANAVETTIRIGDTELVKRSGRSATDGSFAAQLVSGGEYVLTAKGAGEDSKTGTVSVTVSGAPAITSFAATPVAVPAGEASTLSWTTSEATSLEIRSPQGLVFRTEDPAVLTSGSRAVTVFADTTYTLEARNSAGGTVAEATVALIGAPSIQFSASPGSVITGGDQVTLTWAITGATDLSLTADGQGIDLAGQSVDAGSVTLTPATTTTYALVATGAGGTARRELLVQVNARPTIGAFKITPASIELGKTFPLMNWTTQHADTVVVRDQHGTQVDLQGQAPGGGTINFAPTGVGNFVYTLTATGAGGQVQETAALEVIAPVPEIVSFSVPGTVTLPTTGEALTWSTRFATHVEIWDISATPNVLISAPNAPPSGSMNWIPPQEGAYELELRAFGPGGLVSDPARNPKRTIGVAPPFPAVAFEASKTGIVSGDAFTLSWTVSGSTQLKLEESTVSESAGFVALEPFGPGTPLPAVTASPVALTRSLAPGATRGDHYFRFSAKNTRGETVKIVKVTVGTTPPQILAFTGLPNPVQRTHDLELSWTASDTSSVKVFEGTTLLYNAPFYEVTSGAFKLQPSTPGTHVYRLEAQGDAGHATQEVTVSVIAAAPVFNALTAAPTTLPLGSPTTLTWRTTDATSVAIRVNGADVRTGLPADGQAEVTPTSQGEVVYEVVATGSGGSATRTVTVQVEPALAVVNTFAATPTTLNVGENLTLSWTASNAFGTPVLTDLNAPEVDYSALMVGQQASSGTISWAPTAPARHRFQLTVTGANPAATKSEILDVAVQGTAPDFGFSFAITPAAGTLGKPVTFTWDAQVAERVFAQPYLPSNDGAFTVVEGAAATDLATSPTATALALTGDDQQVVLPFPTDFKFPFYGEDFSEARVSVNGFVGFGAGHDTGGFSANGPLGTASERGGFLAPFWDDLKMYPDSGAFWDLVGTAPDRALVIQWNKVGFYVYGGAQDSVLTFQAVLHERGEVEYRYLTMEALSEARASEVRGSKATIGIQSPRSPDGSFNHSVNQATELTAGTSLRIQQAIGDARGEFSFVPHRAGDLRYHLHAVGYPATAESEWKSLTVSLPSDLLTFEADRTHVGAGDAVVLTWTSTASTDWTLTFEGTPVPGFAPSADGSATVNPVTSGTFTLSALNAAGDADSLDIPVTVGLPVIESAAFARSIVGVGEELALSWKTSGADSLKLERPDGTATQVTVRNLQDATDRAAIASGSFTETALSGDVVYTLSVTNSSGTVTREFTATSTPAVAISAFTAAPSSGTSESDPLELTAGTSIRLDWATVNADALVITENVGVTSTVLTPAILPNAFRAGSKTRNLPNVTPSGGSDTEVVTYELKASLGAENAFATVPVNVVAKATVTATSGTASESQAVTRGDSVLISYTGKYAARVQLRQGSTVLEESTSETGSFAVSPQATTIYNVVAFNRLGAISSQSNATVYVRPPALQLTVSQRAVVRGAEPVVVSWTSTDAETVVIPGYANLVNEPFADIRTLGLTADLTPALAVDEPTLDDSFTTFSIPFAIHAYGQEFRHVTVSTNGWFGLPEGVNEETPDGHYTSSTWSNPSSLPSSSLSNRNVFGPFWEDLEGHNGKVEWTIIGRAPERVLVIQWTNFDYLHSENYRQGSLTFQGRISEQGEVEYRYGRMGCVSCDYDNELRVFGSSASIAYSRDGSEGVLAFANESIELTNRKVTFTPARTLTGAEAASGSFTIWPAGRITGTGLRLRAIDGPTTRTADVELSVFDRGDLFINEIFPDPVGADAGKEWIELRNVTGVTIPDLRGLRISNAAGQSFTIDGTSARSISSSSSWSSTSPLYILGQSTTVSGTDFAYGNAFEMGDTADTITIWAGNTALFRLQYDASFGLVEGRSLSLDPHARNLALAERPVPASAGGWWCLGRKHMDPANTAYTSHSLDSYNYPCYGFDTVPAPFVTEHGNPAAQGLLSLLDLDRGYRNDIPLPSGFRFFYDGREYDSVSVNVNGFASLGSSSFGISGTIGALDHEGNTPASDLWENVGGSSMVSGRLPAFTIMPFWDEFAADGPNPQIYMRHDAAGGRLIIEWHDFEPTSSTNAAVGVVNFQLHLVKSTTPGRSDGIEFHYGPLEGSPGATCTYTSAACDGSSAQAGLTVEADDRTRSMILFRRLTTTTSLDLTGNTKRVLTAY